MDDFIIIDEDCEMKNEDVKDFMYYDLFMKIGEKKSKKMIHYIFAKVMTFGSDYKNKDRIAHMDKLKEMKPHYKRAFGKEFI